MSKWFSVRCILRWLDMPGKPYEERITLWRADSQDDALNLAESEAQAYAQEFGYEYAGLAQCYELDASDGIGHGTELFSLLRDSDLNPQDYVDRYFATGVEHTADALPSDE
jgi:hypothetical protein